jgi:8-oxo-dGTP pyrophosphatase MutT (NUDIX family)
LVRFAVPDFGGGEFKTRDGLDVSSERPHGVMVVVYRDTDSGTEVLLLHRAGLPNSGDWAWTPPSGARFPGEELAACSERELREETGIVANVMPVLVDEVEWALFAARIGPGLNLRLNEEHDELEWVPANEAIERCRPAVVRNGLSTVLASVDRDKRTLQDVESKNSLHG